MPVATSDPWSQEGVESTLRQLRNDYPGYTTNELYAIWCNVNGRVPVDHLGKVQLAPWRIHAEEDGKHVRGGFRVSTMLFGRAQLAKKGVPKPPRKAQAKRSAPEPTFLSAAGISVKALAFARSYDQAAETVEAIIQKRREVDALLADLSEANRGLLVELAAHSPEARPILAEAGLLE